MKQFARFYLVAILLLGIAASARAAFIVETRSGGLATANYSFTGDGTAASTSSGNSTAIGLTVSGSIFGGDGATFDEYTFSYTPGLDADNFVPSAGTVLGSTDGSPGQGNVASGLAGGASGLYKVYFTVTPSTNVDAAGSRFTLTQNGPDIILDPVGQNNGDTGPDTQVNPPEDPPIFVGGANSAWYLLGTVNLVADGTTYNIIQRSNGVGPFPPAPPFVSQRAQAVMWELVPEPSTSLLLMLGLAAVVLAPRRT